MVEFNMDQFEQDYRNERRKALRDSVKSGKTSLPVGILQHGANRIGEGVSDTVQGIGAFAKSLYNNPQAVAESGAEGLEALYNRVAQEDPMAAMEVAGMVATGGATAAIAKGARLADFATFDPNTSRMFIGDIGAKNLADAGKPVAQKVLQVARQMKMMGATETEIRAKTNQIIEKEDPSLGGVSFNSEGQLVVEIDDSKMAVRSDSAIARATGGYQTPAGGMYFSTDIDNVLKGTPLGKAYPNEINMKVSDVSEAPRENVLGSFDENTNTITSFALKTDVPGVTAHELQHFIQAREGFPRGGNEIDALDGMYGNMANDYDEISTLLRQFNGKPIPNNVYQQFENPEIMRASLSKIRRDHEGDDDAAADFAENQAITIRDDPEDWAKTIYSYLAGEVEARNVQTRLKMTPAERRATPPRETETDARFKMPLSREDQIISKRAQGGEVMQGVGSLNETARNMTRGPRGIGAYQQFASGGEAMGPPPTRGPDPQGIGYFQQFADGGPVYMKEGGEVITPDDIAGMREKIMNDYGFDPEDVAVQEGVPPELFLRLLFKENRGRQGPKSPKGAIGLAQLMPATAKELGVDPTVPYENAVGGARYLKQKIAEFDGDVLLGLAAYNAGAGNVRKYEGVPPFAETQDYVAVILGEGYSGGTSISETIRKEQGFAPSMSYEGQENDVREEQGLVPISMASSGTAEGVGSLMRQESSAPETSLRPVLRPTAPSTSLRPVLRPEESSAPETSLRPVLRGQDQPLREKYAPENFEKNLLSPDAFQYFNGLGVMEREGKKQGIETLDPRGIRRINNFAMERSTMA